MTPTSMKRLQSESHRVDQGYSVVLTFDGSGLQCEWSPRCPSRDELGRILADGLYITARDLFCTEISRSLGRKSLLILEVT